MLREAHSVCPVGGAAAACCLYINYPGFNLKMYEFSTIYLNPLILNLLNRGWCSLSLCNVSPAFGSPDEDLYSNSSIRERTELSAFSISGFFYTGFGEAVICLILRRGGMGVSLL